MMKGEAGDFLTEHTLTSRTNSTLPCDSPSPERTMQTSPPVKMKHLQYLSFCLYCSSRPPEGHPAVLGDFLLWLRGWKWVKQSRWPSARYSSQSESSLLYSNSIDQPEGDREPEISQLASNQDNRPEDAGSNSVCVASHVDTASYHWLSLVPHGSDGKRRQCIHHWY